MTRRLLPALLLAALCFAWPAAGQVEAGRKIGVGEVKISPAALRQANADGVGNDVEVIRESLDSQLVSGLVSTRLFTVVTRENLAEVLRERGADPGQANAAETRPAAAFEAAGCDILVVPTIDSVQVVKNEFEVGGEFHEQTIVTFGVVMVLLDTETGRVLESSNETFAADARFAQALPTQRLSGSDPTRQALRDAAGDAAAFGLNNVLDATFPALVMDVTDNVVTLSRGGGTGIRPGQRWEIYALGEEMRHPYTGRTFRKEVLVGRAEVVRVRPDFSHAVLLDDFDPANVVRGQVARLMPGQGNEPNGRAGR